jgi:hypothetical protein
MACGNRYALSAPNLQAFIKKAEGKYFGIRLNAEEVNTDFWMNPNIPNAVLIALYIKAHGTNLLRFWSKPSIKSTVKIRDIFEITDKHLAFVSEDSNASHARLAVGFGKCVFGRSVLDGVDGHSMFAMMALQEILKTDSTALDAFPLIRDFVKDLTEEQIKSKNTCGDFKDLDAAVADSRFRSAAKTLFYSVLNGAAAEKMRKVLSNALGRNVAIAAGAAMFDKFWSLYSGISEYIKKVVIEAEECSFNLGGLEFNISTLPDGTKLAFPRENGELSTTNIIAAQWSRSEATAVKKIVASVAEMPEEWGVKPCNQVHDEVGLICRQEYWQNVYRFTSDSFAKEYGVYLQGFLPADELTEIKLQNKLAKDSSYIPRSWADK